MKRFPLNVPLLITVLTWAFNFVSIKLLNRDMPPLVVLMDRTLVMGLCLVGYCLLRGISLRYPKGDAVKILFAGFLGLGLYMVLFLEGLSQTTPAEGAIILASAPIFTYLLSCVLKQDPFNRSALVASMVAFAGVAIVILGGNPAAGHGSLTGNLIVLIASVVWACNVVAMRPLLRKYDATRVFTLSVPGAFPLVLLVGLVPAIQFDYASVSTINWILFVQVTVLSGVVAFVTYYVGVHQIGVYRSGMYQFFIPPLAAGFQWMVYGSVLSMIQWAGLLVVMLGVIYSARMRALAAKPLAIPAVALE